MKVEWESKGETTIARIEGRIDSTRTESLQEELQSGLDPKAQAALLDFEKVSFISSAGLRAVLALAKQLKGRNVKMGLCSLSGSLRKIFEVSGFENVIPIYSSQGEAINILNEDLEISDEDFKDLKVAYDVSIIEDNIRHITALTLEKYEYMNDRSLPENSREEALKQMEDALKDLMHEKLKKLQARRMNTLKEMFRLASKTLHNVVDSANP